MLQSKCDVGAARRTGTVEKWTFQLITPRSRLSVIALTRAPVMKRARRERERRGGTREGKSHLARFINFTGRRGNFLNYNALISLVLFSFPLSSVFLLQTRRLPSRSSCRVICSTMRCGDNNYYASKGATVVNLICSFRN